ncbi:T9SS type A sorting domain-containing protein [Spirosoma aureum]|uniref:T9SS type A sorting domain-containing protein n=1 Tax=Spirosoma aureum TaxID=2692134 RepID=A0A6G9AMK3_9BACT|nr:T9SS type A sorting domain-containing protein [Spirosoma aureum]QIP13722.1 T9SS type A sorting domain-containing protein [Spirosoma aureum]
MIAPCALAQPSSPPPIFWDRTLKANIDFPSYDQPASLVGTLPTADGGLLMMIQAAKPILIKLDYAGRTSWTKEFQPGTRIGGVAKAQDDLLVTLQAAGPILMKLNNTGETIWAKEFPTQNNLIRFQQLNDGGIIAILKASWPILTKLEQGGKTAWTKEFTGENDIFSVSETNDGNLLVLGSKRIDSEISTLFTSQIGRDGITRSYFVLYEAGKQYSLLSPMLTPSGLITTSDGGLIVAARSFPAGQTNPVTAELIKFNQQGEMKWKYGYGLNSLSMLFKASDNKYLVGYGGAINYMDNDGNVLFKKDNVVIRGTNLTPTTDGGFVSIFETQAIRANLYLYKYDAQFNEVATDVLVRAPSAVYQSYFFGPTKDGGTLLCFLNSFGVYQSSIIKYNASLGREWQRDKIAGFPLLLPYGTDGSFFIISTPPLLDEGLIGEAGLQVTKQSLGRLVIGRPSYDCPTGSITLNVSGGDGSPVVYTAPGITRSSLSSNSGIVEAELRRDPKPILIQATQSAYTISYEFDLKEACTNALTPLPPVLVQPIPDQFLTVGQPIPGSGFPVGLYFVDPTPYSPNYRYDWSFKVTGLPDGLYVFTKSMLSGPNPVSVVLGTPSQIGVYTVQVQANTASFPDKPVITTYKLTVSAGGFVLVQPTYDCQNGAIHFNTQGGDGSPIEYMSAGITDWTSNPDRFVDKESRTASDVQPFMLYARQNGQTVSYVWNLKAACGRSRLGVAETSSPLTLTLLSNPVPDQVRVLIQGVEGQSVQLRLTNQQGKVLESRHINQVSEDELQQFQINQSEPGVLFLQAYTNTQTQTVKIIKQ